MRKRYVWTGLFLCWTGFASVGAAASDSQVIVEGSQRAAETVRASGHGVPLLRALEQIVPTSYSVNVPNAGAWADTPVSWHGDTPFVRALGEILGGNRTLQAHVNTDLHLVTVTALPASGAALPPTVPSAALIDAPTVAPTAAPVPRASSVPALPALPALPQRQATVQSQYQPPVQTAPLQTQRLMQQMQPQAPMETAPMQQQPRPQPPQMPQPTMAMASAPSMQQSPSLQPQAQAPLLAPSAAPAPSHAYAEQTPLLMPHADSPLPQGTPLSLALTTSAQGTAPTPSAPAAPVVVGGPLPVDPAVARTWELRLSDGSIRTALARWAQDAGWQFIWAVPTDFTVDASATLHGSFEDALHSVVDALSHSQVPIQVVLYKGNHVLRVTAKGAG